MVDEPYVPSLELEFSIPNNPESGDVFNVKLQFLKLTLMELAPQTSTAETAVLQTTTTEIADSVGSDTLEEGFVQSADSSSESTIDSNYVESFDNPVVDDGFDVHEEIRTFWAERRAYKRRTRSERIPLNPKDVPLDEVESGLGFNETEHQDRNLIEK
ncbi:hypothetical protein HAX54_004145, partial [Datura stramonium]|nr:hypothetical protein [Datura stramonium]